MFPHEDSARGYKNLVMGTSLVVQRLRLHAPNAGSPGSIPGWETGSHVLRLSIHMWQLKILQAAQFLDLGSNPGPPVWGTQAS